MTSRGVFTGCFSKHNSGYCGWAFSSAGCFDACDGGIKFKARSFSWPSDDRAQSSHSAYIIYPRIAFKSWTSSNPEVGGGFHEHQ
jgi:hypothetical protein